MNGQLDEHPLAELISEILDKELAGALRVERQRVKAVVYFDAGKIVYATANLHQLRLRQYLSKHGLPATVGPSADSASDLTLARNLMDRKLLSQPALDTVFTEQVSDVLRLVLPWTEGQWTFDERARLTTPVRPQIHIRQLLLDAARRMDSEFLSRRFRNPGEIISPGLETRDALRPSPLEGFLLSRVEGPIALADLLSISALPEAEAHQVIYGLTLAGVLQREFRSYAFREPKPARASKPPKLPHPASTEVTAPQPPLRDPVEELREFLEQLARATNHYEILNVSPSAAAADLKRAYYYIARRFHPDRFHDLARTPLHMQLEAAFARITQAHETLSDPNSRAAYDAKLSNLSHAGNLSSKSEMSTPAPVIEKSVASVDDGNAAIAERRFKEGWGALQSGQTNTAIACLSAAAQLAPDQAQYRAYYGHALASHEKGRRLAEAELQAAVRLDPSNAAYRVMLAELYRALGFSRRAITELQRALSLDPKNTEARNMLESLEVKK